MNYTAEDEILIDRRWNELVESCRKARICKNEEDWNFIRRAFFLAKEAHKGVKRRSGEPYILHPIAVAMIVVNEIGLGVKSVVASLLHDVVEDTDYTVEDIEQTFSPKIAAMVDGLTKMAGVFNTEASEQAEYFRKVLLTLSDDVRVIIIKLADRLHNMRTLGSMPLNKQIKITSETIYLFVPLAYRLGLYAIKSELEDLCMKYRFPKEYEEISRKIEDTQHARQAFIDKFTAPIIEVLDRDNIKYEISGRIKSIYSIWQKMQRKQISFEEIYDIFAIRIVFQALPFPSEKTQCWQIYSSITDIYTPKQERLRDWISIPKSNGYEALHSTVMGPDGIWVNGPTDSAIDFLDNFKLSLYTSEIVVFTPKGEAHKMPNGATALDFAYEIHTKIGNHAIGAKINHKIEPITAHINSGDQIEIITAETAHPKAEWLEVVTTSKAQQSIKTFLKRERQNNIEHGQKMLSEQLGRHNIIQNGRVLRKIMSSYECLNKDELYSKIGAGIISLDNLDKLLKENASKKILKFWKLFIPGGNGNATDETGTESEHAETPQTNRMPDKEPEFVIAECCRPIPGDRVVGYRDPATNHIIVHKATCETLTRLAAQFGKNIVKEEIKWSQQKAESYLATVELRGIDRSGIILDITKVITVDFSINMREINIRNHDGIFDGLISLYVKNTEDLNALLDNIRKIKGIESVKRLINY